MVQIILEQLAASNSAEPNELPKEQQCSDPHSSALLPATEPRLTHGMEVLPTGTSASPHWLQVDTSVTSSSELFALGGEFAACPRGPPVPPVSGV